MDTRSILPAVWQVPQEFRDRLGSQVGRQRAMLADEHLLLVLHAPPQPDEDERRGRFFWRRPDGSWSSSEGGEGLVTLRRHFEEYERLIEQFDKLEEKAATAEEYFHLLENLSPIQRATRNLYDAMQEGRKGIEKDRNLIDLRDEAYELARRAELMYHQTKNGLDYAIAKRVEQQSKTSHQMAVASHRLNMLVAFFFPIATLSSVFGVNLRHGLENRSITWFVILIAIGLASGFALQAFVANQES